MLPANVTRIDAPTSYVWIIGRTKTDGPPDYEAVHAKIMPTEAAVPAKVDPSVDMKTPPKEQIDSMPADKFFTYAAEILKQQDITDQPLLEHMKRIGIQRGKSFN
jgi:hypothetical protein